MSIILSDDHAKQVLRLINGESIDTTEIVDTIIRGLQRSRERDQELRGWIREEILKFDRAERKG